MKRSSLSIVLPVQNAADRLPALVAEAVQYLATQGERAMTHELVLTPAGDRWTP